MASRSEDGALQPHYMGHKVEPIDLIESYDLGFNHGNVVKYVTRHREKNGRRDLEKALWFLLRDLGFSAKRIKSIITQSIELGHAKEESQIQNHSTSRD